MARARGATAGRLRNYLLAGVLTVIPIWITWLIFEFIVRQLSSFGRPWVFALSRPVRRYWPELADIILQPWFENVLAVIITLLGLLLLGWITTRVVGRKLLATFDGLVQSIPFVEKIYGATKALLTTFEQKPGQSQRVVLIEFPSPDMKTVGFVTRIINDADTGRKLAAVYVPTTPNPTSGYMELVPIERITTTDWTLEEAMSFVMSGGTVSPTQVNYERGVGSIDDVPEDDREKEGRESRQGD